MLPRCFLSTLYYFLILDFRNLVGYYITETTTTILTTTTTMLTTTTTTTTTTAVTTSTRSFVAIDHVCVVVLEEVITMKAK